MNKGVLAALSAAVVVGGCSARQEPPPVPAAAGPPPLEITRHRTSRPDREGYVDLSLAYVNRGDKTIERAGFRLIARDLEGNALMDEISLRYEKNLEDPGPVPPGGGRERRWSRLWRNHRIICSEIMESRVFYRDGNVAQMYANPARPNCR